jgi:site-specific DNA recombinase
MFAQRLAWYSPPGSLELSTMRECPSASDSGRNPRYTGRQERNRQRTDFDPADPADANLGHRQVQRWNLPEGWVISKYPAHAVLASKADFIATLDTAAPCGPAVRRYLLAGLLTCRTCGRRLESIWSNGKPPIRTATATPAPPARNQDGLRPRDQNLPHVAALSSCRCAQMGQRRGTPQVVTVS